MKALKVGAPRVVAIAVVPWASILPAVDEDPLVTDRPDFTEGVLAVDKERWQVEMGATFAELHGFEREEARGPSTLTFQAGVTHLLGPNLQLDARAARRLSGAGPDLLVGVGASWRH